MENSPYLTSQQAAKFLSVNPGTLSRWRWKNLGPKYYKIHTRVVYKREDLEAWVEQNNTVSE